MSRKFDFCGYVTKNDMLCSDGLTIKQNAFSECDGKTVPIFWRHQHDDIGNVLGNCVLECREDGVYGYGSFNNTDDGIRAKEVVTHGDISGLSIFANKLRKIGSDVVKGVIKEVSLVVAGANPGAFIDTVAVAQSEDGFEEMEAVIYSEFGFDELLHEEEDDPKPEPEAKEPAEDPNPEPEIDPKPESEEPEPEAKPEKDESLEHEDSDKDDSDENESIEDIIKTMNTKQQNVLYYLLTNALADSADEGEKNDKGESMLRHAFDTQASKKNTLSHEDMKLIMKDAQRLGSLKDAVEFHLEDGGVLAHMCSMNDALAHEENGGVVEGQGEGTYGIKDIDWLFPDPKTLNNPPEFIKRPDEWVSEVTSSVHRIPFSRIKSQFADITEDEARAKGYIKGKEKKEEVFSLLKRVTTPTTVYKLQKLDRDDTIDITDFDVVAWIKAEMRMMLDEELAGAFLFGDGRSAMSDDKIDETHIRPVCKDADLFTITVEVAGTDAASYAGNMIDEAIRGRKDYRGSGNLVLFTTQDYISEMLLQKDANGRRIYKTMEELATAMMVRKIVPVPADIVARGGSNLLGVAVNLRDYNVGADKGGSTSFFDDFDIKFNAYYYLIECRCSGALVKPKSAMKFVKKGL